jgi:hypothetical protein
MNIVEIHTKSGSHYTLTDFGDLTTLNVTRPEGHPLGQYGFFSVTDWALKVTNGVLVGVFTVDSSHTGSGTLTTSAVTEVRQQIVKGAFV